jgi:hypothetical protein
MPRYKYELSKQIETCNHKKITREENLMTRPKKCTENELNKVGVTIIDKSRLLLQCTKCKAIWSPEIKGNRMHNNYWKCPACSK